MPTFNFDQLWSSRRLNRRATIFGQVFADLPDLPFELGLRLALQSTDSGDPTPVFREVIDFVFGAGQYARWTITTADLEAMSDADLRAFGVQAGVPEAETLPAPDLVCEIVYTRTLTAGQLIDLLVWVRNGYPDTLPSEDAAKNAPPAAD